MTMWRRNAALAVFCYVFLLTKAQSTNLEETLEWINNLNISPDLLALLESGNGADEILLSSNDTEGDSDVAIDPQTTFNQSAIDEILITPPGVDPNNPEEIARKEVYSKDFDAMQYILDINLKHYNRTDLLEGDMKKSVFRNAGGRTWPKGGDGLVRIGYTIAKEYKKNERDLILDSLKEYSKYTCIRFQPRKSESQFIHISDRRGCWAHVGRTGGPSQTVSLGVPSCMSKGVALHELMHTLGFQHEQSRSDRDDYVKVIGENIEGGWNSNYNKIESTRNLVVYDYGSVMHYGRSSFAKKGYLPAMVVNPDRSPRPTFGQRQRLSPYDIEEINILYNCAPGSFKRCGKDYNAAKGGNFKSPNYPKAYPSGAHCTWKITAARGKYVEATFSNIDIEETPLCQQDGVLIHDGGNPARVVLKRICGKKSKQIVIGTQREMYIIFSSDTSPSQGHKGFSASFRQVSQKGSYTPSLKAAKPTLAPIRDTVESINCNFDNNNFCGLIQDKDEELDFIINRGKTPTVGTGPNGDHTSGTGRYLYLESSLPSRVGDRGVLRTPWFRRSDRFCIRFSYHMYGQYMGGLRLYAFEKRANSNYGTPIRIWEKFDDQKNKWHNFRKVYSPKKNVQYVQFYIEGFVNFYLSDISLDDFIVLKGPCSGPVPTAKPQPKPETTTVSVTTTPLPGRLGSTFSCDFERGLCGMRQSQRDTFDWTARRGRTPTQGTGPVTDHTTGRGQYYYIESSQKREGNTAMLESPALTPSSHCLTMWYNMNGRTIGKLTIYKEVNGARTMLKEVSGHKGQPWVKASMDVLPDSRSAKYVKVLIEGTTGSGSSGDIAIDDLVITDSSCGPVATISPASLETRFTCDFETGMCGLTQANDDNFDWTRRSGASPSQDTGPTFDNTRNSASGYYIFTESSSPQRRNDIAKLMTPKMRPGTYCIQFAYHMRGTSVGSIEVMSLEDNSDTPTVEWLQDGDQGNQWHSASFSYTSPSKVQYIQFIFQGQIGNGFSSDVALDDIVIESGACRGATRPPVTTPRTTQRPTTNPVVGGSLPSTFACNFQQSICGMVQSRQDNFDWRILSGATPSRFTGPSGDHTTNQNGEGRYLYVEGSSPQRPRQRSVISTPDLSANSRKVCLVFYYHMLGRAMGSLDVFVDYSAPSRPLRSQSIFTKQGTQGDRWIQGEVEIDVDSRYRAGSMSIRFRATIGATSSSDIGLDDICVADGPCGAASQCRSDGVLVRSTAAPITTRTTRRTTTAPATTTTRPTTTPRTTTRPVVTHPNAFACNFDTSICRMSQDRNDNFDWARIRGATRSRYTGPSGDNTANRNGNGYYLYAEASAPQRPGQSTMISTPRLSASTRKACVIFHYHMFGRSMGTLNVFVDYAAPGRTALSLSIFSKSGLQGKNWKQAQVEVDVDSRYSSGTMKIRFRGTLGRTSSSDMALDDICVASGPCGSSSRCRPNGQLVATTAAPPPPSTTRRPQPAPGSVVRPPPPSNMPPMEPGMNLCTFEGDRTVPRRPTSTLPTNSEDLGPYVSSAKDNMCGFFQFNSIDNFNWTRHQGRTPSSRTGPTTDKTTGRGHYMYIETSRRRPGDVAFIQTYFMPASDYCVDFDYHMYGVNTGRLLVRAVETLSNSSRVRPIVGSLSGDKGNSWRHMSMDFQPESQAVMVGFRLEGYRGDGHRGDLAIDDISVMPGSCDACRTPSHQHRAANGLQRFSTGCIHTQLFYVRCCNSSKPKAIYRRVRSCRPNMFNASRLHWYCQNL